MRETFLGKAAIIVPKNSKLMRNKGLAGTHAKAVQELVKNVDIAPRESNRFASGADPNTAKH